MLRKILFRTFVAGTVLTGLIVVGVVIAGFLAFQQPAFYAGLRAHQSVDPQVLEEVESRAQDFDEWARLSAAQARQNEPPLPPETVPQQLPSVPATFTYVLTEAQLNTMFASEDFSAGDVRNPRVQLLDEKLRFGSEIRAGDSSFIFSVDLKPQINSNGSLQLEMMSARLGTLPFPLHSLLDLLAANASLSDPSFRLDLSGEAPVVTLNIQKQGRQSVTIKSVRCRNGEIAIKFRAPARSQNVSDRLSFQGDNSH